MFFCHLLDPLASEMASVLGLATPPSTDAQKNAPHQSEIILSFWQQGLGETTGAAGPPCRASGVGILSDTGEVLCLLQPAFLFGAGYFLASGH
jgi:hypothetical protein